MSFSISPRLSSGLCLEPVPFWPFAMNGFVALLANHQRLAAAGCHPLDPERFVVPAWSLQVSQFADVVNLAVPSCSAQLAFLRQKALPSAATFTNDSQNRLGVSHLAYLERFGYPTTCLPSPCGRLSRPRTTTETPLP